MDGFGSGNTRASRVAIGALADGIPNSKKGMRFKDVAGEGASPHTRGRVCSPKRFALTLAEDLCLNIGIDAADNGA